jgi:hypothetical protein
MLSCTRPARGSGAPSAMLSRRSFMVTPRVSPTPEEMIAIYVKI